MLLLNTLYGKCDTDPTPAPCGGGGGGHTKLDALDANRQGTTAPATETRTCHGSDGTNYRDPYVGVGSCISTHTRRSTSCTPERKLWYITHTTIVTPPRVYVKMTYIRYTILYLLLTPPKHIRMHVACSGLCRLPRRAPSRNSSNHTHMFVSCVYRKL